MTTTVRIPTPLRSYTAQADEVEIEGSTVREVLCNLGNEHEGVLERLP